MIYLHFGLQHFVLRAILQGLLFSGFGNQLFTAMSNQFCYFDVAENVLL